MKPTAFSRSLLLAVSSLLTISYTNAGQIWDGGGADNNWNTAANWDGGSGGALPTFANAITFQGNTRNAAVNNLTAASTIGGINFTNTGAVNLTNAFTLSGNSITLGGNITTSANTTGSTITDTISLDMILNGDRTFTTNQLSNSVQHNLAVSGIISQSGGTRSLTKAGAGTLTLSGANSYTGTTTINGGVLDLGGGTATGSLASTVLTLNGGSLSYTRTGNTTQSFTTTNINSGAVASAITVAAGNTLNLGNIVRATGATLDLSATGTLSTSSANVGGILAGFTHGGNTWAVGNGAGVAITGLATYTNSSVAGTTAANYANNNIDVDNSAGVLDAAITANSLRFSAANANTLTLAAGTNTLTSGGILVGSGVGANLSTITGGTLRGAASKDLVVFQNNTSGGLTISSDIANNTAATALAKSGEGLLTLSGNNTFTGGLFINSGTVALGGSGALNSTAGAQNAVTFTAGSTGKLTLAGNSVVVSSLNTNAVAGTTVVENASGTPATLTIGNSLNLVSTFAGVIQDGTGGGSLGLIKAGTNTLTLSGPNTYSGGTVINAGAVALGSGVTGAIGTGPITINTGGRLTVNNTALNRTVTLAGGTLALTGGTVDTISGSIAITANSTFDFVNSNGATGTIASSMSGVGGITKTGTGTLKLTGSSINYGGPTVVSGGILQVQQSLYGNDTSKWTPANITVNSGTQLALSIGGANDFSVAQASTFITNISTNVNNNGLLAGATIGLDSGNAAGTVNFTGVIADSTGLGGGAVNVKVGVGAAVARTIILSGDNTYTGKTTITNWLSSTSASTTLSVSSFNSVATNVALGTVRSTSSNLGAPTTVANGTIDIGNGSQQTSANLIYTGSGETTDRVLNFPGNANSPSTIDQAGGGLLKFTSAVTNVNAKTLNLTGVGNGEFVGGLASFGAINKSGTGTWTFSGSNTYTGLTTVTGGALVLANANALNGGIGATGGLGALTFNGGVIGLGAGDFSRPLAAAGTIGAATFTGAGGWAAYGADRAVNLGGAGAAITWATASTGFNGQTLILGNTTATNTVDLQNPLALGNAARTVRVDNGAAAVDGILSGALSGTGGGLTKTGTGTLSLTATNLYTGATQVNAGTLLINGSTSTSSAVTVASGATLGGTGTIGGTVSVQSGGTFSPGASIESIASGNLTLLANSTFAQEINKSVASGVSGDLTVVSGSLNITTGAILTLTELGTLGTWAAGDTITLIGYSTGTLTGGLFTYLDNPLNDDSTFTFSGIDWVFDYNDTAAGDNFNGDMSGFTDSARYVTMTAIPEPSAALLGGLGALLLLRRRR